MDSFILLGMSIFIFIVTVYFESRRKKSRVMLIFMFLAQIVIVVLSLPEAELVFAYFLYFMVVGNLILMLKGVIK